jgi:hypothetical protein
MNNRTSASTMTASTQRARNALIGSPIERVEDFRFLTGRGQYVGC